MKLQPNLIPKSAWGQNCRAELSQEEWDGLRGQVFAESNYHCEICQWDSRDMFGTPGSGLHCHEQWEFDYDSKKQTLVRLMSICPQCHMVKHIGLAQVQGKYQEAINWFCIVNDTNKVQAESIMCYHFDDWAIQSKMDWVQDYTHLENYGVYL